MYEFQLGEINAVNIKEKEDEELGDRDKLLFNSGKISEKVGRVCKSFERLGLFCHELFIENKKELGTIGWNK